MYKSMSFEDVKVKLLEFSDNLMNYAKSLGGGEGSGGEGVEVYGWRGIKMEKWC